MFLEVQPYHIETIKPASNTLRPASFANSTHPEQRLKASSAGTPDYESDPEFEAERYERMAVAEEVLGKRMRAAIDWAAAAIKHLRWGRYAKAALCDKRSAQLNEQMGKPEIAIEHYIYAGRNFEMAGMANEKDACIQSVNRLNPVLLGRIRIVESVLANKTLNPKAVRRLVGLPALLTLVGVKPAAVQYVNSSNINVIDIMRFILNTYFNNELGLFYWRDRKNPEKIWYCIYDKNRAMWVLRKEVAGAYAPGSKRVLRKEVKDTYAPGPKIDEEGGLEYFIKRAMIIDMPKFKCIVLGYPINDVMDMVKYYRLWAEVGVRLPEAEFANPDDPRYSAKLTSLKDRDAAFIRQFHQAVLDYRRISYRAFRKIGFGWVSVRPKTKESYLERYMAIVDALKVFIKVELVEGLDVPSGPFVDTAPAAIGGTTGRKALAAINSQA